MRAVRRKGTKAEQALWEALTELGLSFQRNQRPIPSLRREADVLFRREKVAVFVDGCFWHGCPLHGTQAKANAGFWERKISRNKERDRETNEILASTGWFVVRIWEHVEPRRAAGRVVDIVRSRSERVSLDGGIEIME